MSVLLPCYLQYTKRLATYTVFTWLNAAAFIILVLCGDYSKPTITRCSKTMFIPTISKSIVVPIKCATIQGVAFNQVNTILRLSFVAYIHHSQALWFCVLNLGGVQQSD